ncbi:MAG: winged helix-turn-helix domain-containing protein [Vibrionaceae bacterium]|nr:winged helix-turn-helix domain-containing protein [Vibrionaceae bacterium]
MALSLLNKRNEFKFLLAHRYEFDAKLGTLTDILNDQAVTHMRSNESRILLALCIYSHRAASRDELIEFAWRDKGLEVDGSSLTQAVYTLRKVLSDSTRSPNFVKTVPKIGYRLVCDVDVLPSNNEDNNINEAQVLEKIEHDPMLDAHDMKEKLSTVELHAKRQNVSSLFVYWRHWLVATISLCLPILSYSFSDTSAYDTARIQVIQGLTVELQNDEPKLARWLNNMDHCFEGFIGKYADLNSLDKVILSSGYDKEVVLNLIHRPPHSAKNQTLALYLVDDVDDSVCQDKERDGEI